VNDTAFELLPLHAVVEISPTPPETKVVPPSGGLNTKTSTVPGCAMSVAVTVAAILLSWPLGMHLGHAALTNERCTTAKQCERVSGGSGASNSSARCQDYMPDPQK